MNKQGWKNIVLLRFSDATLKYSQNPHEAISNTYALKSEKETDLSPLLKQIEQENGVIGSFIHIQPAAVVKSEDQLLTSDLQKTVLKQVFFIAKHLKDSLTKPVKTARNSFLVVTRINGQLGFGDPRYSSPITGGLYGLVKTANIEWKNVFCRSIDIDPDMDEAYAAEHIVTELSDADYRLTEVGYIEDKRSTLIAEVEEQSNEIPARQYTITPDDLFLVSGGAKGVTSSCVKHLSQQRPCKFILLGRSEILENEPDWAIDCHDDMELKKRCMNDFINKGEKPTPVKIMQRLKPIYSSREIKQTLQEIETNGSQVFYLSVDIKDSKELKKQIDRVTKQTGPITGLIHGAGVLADKLIEHKTEQDFDAVYSTKIEGLNSLMSVIPDKQLKHFVLFSSAAGFYGNEAQSDYSVANEILNKYAHHFKYLNPDCHVSAINWGPWDGGMVTPELKTLFKQRNIDIIPIEVGASIMTTELSTVNSEVPQVVIGSSMIVPNETGDDLQTYCTQRQLTVDQNLFLHDHVIGENAVLPIICAISWMANGCEQLYPGYQFIQCNDAKVLKGIVFEKNSPAEYFLEISETYKSNQEIDFNTKVYSINSKNKQIFRYSSCIKLAQKKRPDTRYAEFNPVEDITKPGIEFYEDGTLFHGSLFRNVKKMINITSQKLTLQCQTPDITTNDQGQFPISNFNPFADDAGLQALLIWAKHQYQAGSLPLSIQQIEIFRQTPFQSEYYVSMDVQSSSQNKLSAIISIHDDQGGLYSRFHGAEAIISKNLNQKFVK